MFERFTDQARRVVVVAQEESRKLGHDYIGTEHILLGILGAGESVAVQALASLGVSQEAAREQVEEIVGRGSHQVSGHIPFTPRAKKVLELSLREAIQLGHNYIGTEHILLGLIREGEGVAAQALASLGVSLEAARQQVEEIAGRGSRQVPGHIPFTPRAKKVLELSLREAMHLGRNYIGTEHILLGLIREGKSESEAEGDGEGVAVQVLTRLGADPDQTRQRVIRLLHGPPAAETVAESIRPSRHPGTPSGLDAIRDRLDTIAGQLAAVVTRLGIGGQAPPAGSAQRPPGDAAGAELDRLRRVIDNLQAQLRRHGIEPDPDGTGEAGPPAGTGS